MSRRIAGAAIALTVLFGCLLGSPQRAQAAWRVPGAPVAGMRSTTAVAISWSPVWGTPRYLVKYSTNRSWSSPKYRRTTQPTAELTGLRPGTRYYVKVAVTRTSGSKLSRYGRTAEVVTRESSSSYLTLTPGGLRVVSHDEDSVRLAWRARSGAGSYQVQYASNANLTGARYASTKSTSLTIAGLAKSTGYWFRLRTKSSRGVATSTFSAPIRARTTSGEAFEPLRAATYNVWCATCSGSRTWAKRRAKLVAAIKAQNLDVLGVQEASQGLTAGADGTRKAQFDDLLDLLGSRYALSNAYRYNCEKSTSPNNCKPKYWGASGGVRIIYNADRNDLLRQGAVQYDTQVPGDTKRFVAWAELRQSSTAKRFFVVNTHLDPHSDSSGSTYHHRIRAAQTRQLLATVRQQNRAGLPVVILGDFKSSKYAVPSNAPYDLITSAGYDDPLGNTYRSQVPDRLATVERRVGTEYNTKNNLDGFPPRSDYINGSVIDYVFASAGVRVQEWQTVVDVTSSGRFDGSPPSDHNMVRVSLYLP